MVVILILGLCHISVKDFLFFGYYMMNGHTQDVVHTPNPVKVGDRTVEYALI
jgi:hypothetical protein